MPLFPTTVPVLPALNGFSVKKKPIFAATVVQAVTGREITSAQQAFPIWDFDLTYEALRTETQNQDPFTQYQNQLELEQILTVFLACSGQYSRFYYDDPTDNSRTGQVIATGDGVSATFQIIRTFGTGSTSLSEPVGGLNTLQPYQFYINGTPTTGILANYNRTITFSVAPEVGDLITCDFYFYYLCRFLSDMNDFEQFLTNLWRLGSLKFRSVKFDDDAASAAVMGTPVPPSPSTDPPEFDDYGTGRNAAFPGDPFSTISLSSDASFNRLLTTTEPNDLIIVFVECKKDHVATPPVVTSIASTSGISFSRLGGGTQLIGDTGINLECWIGYILGILTNEDITATLSVDAGTAWIFALAISGARPVAPADLGVNPPAFDGDAVTYPSVTITTTNTYDILLWAAGGIGSAQNTAPPTGYSSVFNGNAVTLAENPLAVVAAYKVVSEIQSEVTVEPGTVNRGTGVCLLAAIRN